MSNDIYCTPYIVEKGKTPRKIIDEEFSCGIFFRELPQIGTHIRIGTRKQQAEGKMKKYLVVDICQDIIQINPEVKSDRDFITDKVNIYLEPVA